MAPSVPQQQSRRHRLMHVKCGVLFEAKAIIVDEPKIITGG